MRPQVITTTAPSDDLNGIAEDQTTGAAGDLTLDGALVSGGVATMGMPQIVSIEGSEDNGSITFTVTGTDQDGQTVSEVITGPDNSTVTSTVYFKTVTQIAASAAVTGNVEVGPAASDGFSTESVPVNWRQSPFDGHHFIELVTSTATFGNQYTVDDPEGSYTTSFGVDAAWFDGGLDPDSNAATGSAVLDKPVRAVRTKCTTATSTTVLKSTWIQGQNG